MSISFWICKKPCIHYPLQRPPAQSMGHPRTWVSVCGVLFRICQNSSYLEGYVHTGPTKRKSCALEHVGWAPFLSYRYSWGHALSPCSKAVLECDNHMANEALGYAGKALLDKIHNETRILKDPSYFFLNSLEWRLQKTASDKQTMYIVFLKEKAIYFIHYSLFLSHLFFILFPAKASKSQVK